MPGRHWVRRAAGFVVVVAAVAGCGQTVPGLPQAGMAPVELTALNLGPYPGEPVDYESQVSTKMDVFRIEARRMLGFLVSPDEVDPEMDHLDELRVVESLDSLFGEPPLGIYPAAFKPVMDRNFLLAGVTTTRSNNTPRTIRNTLHSLLRFPSDAAARTAAAELATTMAELVPGGRRVPVPGHSGLEFLTADDKKGFLFAARGPFTLLSMVTLPAPDPAGLGDRIGKLVTLQYDRIDKTPVVPVDEILDLPADPDGIMRRTLPPGDGEYSDLPRQFVGALSPAARLHFERDAAALRPVFERAGVDLVGQYSGVVYRTADLQSAFLLQTALARLGRYDEEIDPPPGLTDARCWKIDDRDPVRSSTYKCALVRGRYVAVVESARMTFDAGLYQRAAAQYSILAKSE
ncbi:DUF7373 family lipoprotein [Nocardia farcinica]|uniref:DUF7373 family lipoprotein n=1 Tax=Nocardia farcinica TaxID=37329 RepID=UPI0024564900|nr:hypothetical protein [Nocardia farcinica]